MIPDGQFGGSPVRSHHQVVQLLSDQLPCQVLEDMVVVLPVELALNVSDGSADFVAGELECTLHRSRPVTCEPTGGAHFKRPARKAKLHPAAGLGW
jgi:hypothetical protein